MKKVAWLFFFTSTVLASMSIVSPVQDAPYFLGEEVRVAGSIHFDAPCTDTLALYVDGVLTEKKTVNAEAGNILKIEDFFVAPLSLSEANHTIRISGCGEDASVDFKTTSRLGISYSANTNRLMLNDVLVVDAKAYKRTPLDGLAKIKISGTTFAEHAEKAFQTPGMYAVLITAQDEYGNRGEESFSVNASDRLSLFTSTSKPAYDPGETVAINMEVRDAWNRERTARVVVLFDEEGREYNVTGFGAAQILLPYYTVPGVRVLEITADSNENIARQNASFFVNGKKSFNYSTNAAGDTLTASLENIGNLALENISVTICDDAGCTTKNTSLGVREQKSIPFKIAGKNATLRINDETGATQQTTISTTGWAVLSPATLAGLFAAVLFVLAYAAWRYKKRSH